MLQRPPKLNRTILGPEYTYGLLIPGRAGLGEPNLATTACVQQAVYRFFQWAAHHVREVHTVRHSYRELALFQNGPSDHKSWPEPIN